MAITKTRMAEIKKEAKASAKNKLVIKFGYDQSIVFPFEDGITVLNALEHAEHYDDSQYNDIYVKPLSREISTLLLTEQAYLDCKIKHLLGLEEKDVTNE